MIQKYSAGENIASYCTKCVLVLDHTIVAMDRETIVKVKCRTCGSIHRYRDAGDTGRKRTAAKASPAKTEVIWEACLAEAKGKERQYDRSEKYCVGDIVDHPVFGRGVVRKVYVNKCDVLFRDKERLMASAN